MCTSHPHGGKDSRKTPLTITNHERQEYAPLKETTANISIDRYPPPTRGLSSTVQVDRRSYHDRESCMMQRRRQTNDPASRDENKTHCAGQQPRQGQLHCTNQRVQLIRRRQKHAGCVEIPSTIPCLFAMYQNTPKWSPPENSTGKMYV